MGVESPEFKQRQRAVWGAGDWPELAQHIQSVSDGLAERLGIEAGQRVLDVATGSGNCAVAAARRGATVTGIDFVPALVEAARARAAAEGLSIEYLEGDAEDLPVETGSFDRVTSVFGAMFAPRHELAAAELVRACAPGGTIGVAAWTPEGGIGQMFATVSKHMPPPPDGFVPPVLWGSEDHVRGLFEPHGVELEFERGAVVWEADSLEEWVDYNEHNLGPLVMARAALEAEGRWDALHADLVEFYGRMNEATDGTLRVVGEYLVTVARVP